MTNTCTKLNRLLSVQSKLLRLISKKGNLNLKGDSLFLELGVLSIRKLYIKSVIKLLYSRGEELMSIPSNRFPTRNPCYLNQLIPIARTTWMTRQTCFVLINIFNNLHDDIKNKIINKGANSLAVVIKESKKWLRKFLRRTVMAI